MTLQNILHTHKPITIEFYNGTKQITVYDFSQIENIKNQYFITYDELYKLLYTNNIQIIHIISSNEYFSIIFFGIGYITKKLYDEDLVILKRICRLQKLKTIL